MFIEIGHFYTDQKVKPEMIEYLKNYSFSNDDHLALFIDDYNVQSNLLNLEWLKDECEKIVNQPVHIHFESDMLKFYPLAIQVANQLAYEKELTKPKPSCLMLSFTWSLYRLGFFDGLSECNEILTIIDKKYKRLEEKVNSMIPSQFKGKVYYQFI